MRKTLSSLIVLSCVGLPALALAQTAGTAGPIRGPAQAWYVETLASEAEVKVRAGSGFPTARPSVMRLVVGYEFNPRWSVEVMGGLNLASDGVPGTGEASLRVRVEQLYGLYLRPNLEIGPGLQLFGRLGVSEAQILSYSNGTTSTLTESHPSYGLGLSYRLSARTALVADYMRYGHSGRAEINSTGLGVQYRF
jgi:hypothetical protein